MYNDKKKLKLKFILYLFISKKKFMNKNNFIFDKFKNNQICNSGIKIQAQAHREINQKRSGQWASRRTAGPG